MADRELTAALAGSATAALRAPSIHNTQPWRWVVRTASLELYADRSRQLTAIDPDGRLVLISCGGALHHARVALAANGFVARVSLLPNADPDHVATLTPTETVPAEHAAGLARDVAADRDTDRGTDRVDDSAGDRGTDRGTDRGAVAARARELLSAEPATPPTAPALGEPPTPRPPAPPPPSAIAALVEAASAEGVSMRVLDRAQVIDLAGATSVTRKMRERIGLDSSTVYAVLYGEEETPAAWVRAGEALSAVWLEAARLRLSVYPSWTVVDLPGSRKVMRRQLSGTGVPYLALRIALAGSDA